TEATNEPDARTRRMDDAGPGRDPIRHPCRDQPGPVGDDRKPGRGGSAVRDRLPGARGFRRRVVPAPARVTSGGPVNATAVDSMAMAGRYSGCSVRRQFAVYIPLSAREYVSPTRKLRGACLLSTPHRHAVWVRAARGQMS